MTELKENKVNKAYIYFVRHGETEYNVSLRLQGQAEVPLNDNGRAQARRAGMRLSKMNKPFDAIITSDSARAKETASIIKEELCKGKHGQNGAGVWMESTLLRERDVGSYEGLLLREMMERFGWEKYPEPRFIELIDQATKEGNTGEQKAAYLNRVLDAVHMLASTIHSLATGDGHKKWAIDQPRILVVSHGLTIRVLLSILFFGQEYDWRRQADDWRWLSIDIRNTSVSHIRVDLQESDSKDDSKTGKGTAAWTTLFKNPYLMGMNDCCHLDEEQDDGYSVVSHSKL